MSNSISLGSTLTNTRMRTPKNLSQVSGMCTVCSADCTGFCEVGLSAVRGSEAIYPFATDINQFASEKNYPLDFSHFSINGRAFGVWGCHENSKEVAYPQVKLETTFGKTNKVALKAPIILPAIAKLNWKDYYSGAALAGVLAVIGEDVVAKDKNLVLKEGKVVSSPLLKEMVSSYRAYQKGFGDIILQANADDENLGVLDYAIKELNVKSVELKFGQAAKGIQGMTRVKNIDEAIKYQKMGYLVFPDPSNEEIAESYKHGIGQVFERIGKLPLWNESHLIERVADLREMGAERICFKTGPFDPKDLITILQIASKADVDLVTFDGAGGGTGNSPVKMMNEWGMSTIGLESIVHDILEKLQDSGYDLPQIAIAGGFAMEDQVFKGLALGAPYVTLVGIGRAAMAAAMVGKRVGNLILNGNIPKEYERYGSSIEEIFDEVKRLRCIYKDQTDQISPGAIGVYSYLQRIFSGLQQLMTLNRKFSLEFISREDIIPLTGIGASVSGLKTYEEKLQLELMRIGSL